MASALWEEKNPLFIAWFYGRMSGQGTARSTAGTPHDQKGASVGDGAPPRQRTNKPAGVVPRKPAGKQRARLPVVV
jgi:hypothetical protein